MASPTGTPASLVSLNFSESNKWAFGEHDDRFQQGVWCFPSSNGEEAQCWGHPHPHAFVLGTETRVGVDIYISGAELHFPRGSAELMGEAPGKPTTERTEKGLMGFRGEKGPGMWSRSMSGPVWWTGSFWSQRLILLTATLLRGKANPRHSGTIADIGQSSGLASVCEFSVWTGSLHVHTACAEWPPHVAQ